jgi:hypothetical protein
LLIADGYRASAVIAVSRNSYHYPSVRDRFAIGHPERRRRGSLTFLERHLSASPISVAAPEENAEKGVQGRLEVGFISSATPSLLPPPYDSSAGGSVVSS